MGPDPDMTFDCNFPVNTGIFKVANPMIKTTWTSAVRLLQELIL